MGPPTVLEILLCLTLNSVFLIRSSNQSFSPQFFWGCFSFTCSHVKIFHPYFPATMYFTNDHFFHFTSCMSEFSSPIFLLLYIYFQDANFFFLPIIQFIIFHIKFPAIILFGAPTPMGIIMEHLCPELRIFCVHQLFRAFFFRFNNSIGHFF